jgi:N-dimethylarginine dimethylaminohydrolase
MLVEAAPLCVMSGAGVVLRWGRSVLAGHGDRDDVGGTATIGELLEIAAVPAIVLLVAFAGFRTLRRQDRE